MSGPATVQGGAGMLPAGRYKLELHRVGPLAADIALAEPCYVLQATPYVDRAARRSLAVPANSAGSATEPDWHLLLVLAIPAEDT